MKTLRHILLFLSCTSLRHASATEINIREVRTLWQRPAVMSETNVSHFPRETPLLPADPGTLADETKWRLSDETQGAASIVNSRNPAALPSLTHVTQNSTPPCRPDNIRASWAAHADGGKCSLVAVEAPVEGEASESPAMKPRNEGVELPKNKKPGSTKAPYGQDIGVASDCSVGYDHQSIVVLDEDPAVMESASFLYEKCPSLSTLLRYHKGALRVTRGSRVRLTKDSRLVLVGHGSSRGQGGAMTLGGYWAEEVAMAAAAMETEDGRVRTVSLVGCELGKDLRFAAGLLQTLRSLHLETELHLSRSALSITLSGEVVTRERGGPPLWRHQDATNKVIAWLDGAGNLLTRVVGSQRGRVVLGYGGLALHIESSEWPTHPQMFIPAELRAKYISIDCLEGLTWSMFFEENEKSRAPDYVLEQSLTLVWLAGRKPVGDLPIKHIVTILDLVREIRYVAKENVNFDLYYVLNDCVYKVQNRTLHVSIAGKYVDSNDRPTDETLRFTSAFEGERDNLTLPELRRGLNASDFNEFCRQTFQFRRCEGSGDGICERWGRYLMAAVFSESVRNFRTFSLFLMSVIACEVSRFQRPDDQICAAFAGDEHPMAGAGTWLERDKRGFYGCSLSTADERTKHDKLDWLELVLHKENFLFARTKARMTSVYGQRDDAELDIFGKVKVVNQYTYASFIEYFRGTKEGRKLSRGCMSAPQDVNARDATPSSA